MEREVQATTGKMVAHHAAGRAAKPRLDVFQGVKEGVRAKRGGCSNSCVEESGLRQGEGGVAVKQYERCSMSIHRATVCRAGCRWRYLTSVPDL